MAASSGGGCGTGSSYLIRKRAGPEIAKRELEFSIAAVDIDLEDDERIKVGRRCRRHG